MGTLGPTSVKLSGKPLSVDVTEAISDIKTSRTIVGASTLTLVLTDPARTLLRSGMFAHKVALTVDGLKFVLVQIQKQGNILNVVFEDANVNALRGKKGQVTAAAGTTTRTAFAKRLVRQTPGVSIVTWPKAPLTREPLSRGTAEAPHEDTWTCLTRLANEVQWRCFSDGTRIWFGPDSWLLSLPVQATLRELTAGVDYVDFDFDVGKPVTNITVNVSASSWSFPPGGPVKLADMGIVNGTWLVNTIDRSLFLPDATVKLAGPQAALPEPSAPDSVTGALAVDGTGSASTAAGIALKTARQQLGVPYLWGGESVRGFDCSGLAQFCYARAGVSLPRTSQTQWKAGPQVTGGLLPGDLVFFVGSDGTATAPGHVGIYIGNGNMIDAPHTGAVVRVEAIASFGSYVGATRPGG